MGRAYVLDAGRAPFQAPLQKRRFCPSSFRAWIDQAESQWVKLDAECIDTVSVDGFWRESTRDRAC